MFTNLFFIILIGVAAVLLIAILFAYRKKMLERNAQKEFDQFILKNNLTVEKEQTLNRNRIAIDRENGKVIFVDKTKTPTANLLINLEDIVDCKMVQQHHPKDGHISSISLRFDLKTANEPVVLCIYKEHRDPMYKMMRLTKKAFYWEKTINLYREMAMQKRA